MYIVQEYHIHVLYMYYIVHALSHTCTSQVLQLLEREQLQCKLYYMYNRTIKMKQGFFYCIISPHCIFAAMAKSITTAAKRAVREGLDTRLASNREHPYHPPSLAVSLQLLAGFSAHCLPLLGSSRRRGGVLEGGRSLGGGEGRGGEGRGGEGRGGEGR